LHYPTLVRAIIQEKNIHFELSFRGSKKYSC
jgi:hypothetical protein